MAQLYLTDVGVDSTTFIGRRNPGIVMLSSVLLLV